MTIASVYWIRFPDHTDVTKEGYVGVARDTTQRFHRHKHGAKHKSHHNVILQEKLLDPEIIMDIIFIGEESECYSKEKELRPNYRIGWNIAPGGDGGSRTLGMKLSDEFKARRRELMIGTTIGKGNKGKPKADEHKRKISEATKGRTISDEQRNKQSEAMRGRKQSPETIEKRRLAAIGKKRGPYKRKSVALSGTTL